MRIVSGLLLLVAAALAYPLAENEEPTKSGVPLVITDYSSVAKSEEAPLPPQQQQQDASSESAESSEKPEDPKTTENPINESPESSEESNENNKPLSSSEEINKPTEIAKPLEEKPLEIVKRLSEEPVKLQEPEIKKIEEKKLEEIPAIAPKLEDSKKPISEVPEEKKPELAVLIESGEKKLPEEPKPEIKELKSEIELKAKNEESPAVKLTSSESAGIVEAARKPAPIAEESAPIPEVVIPALKSETPLTEIAATTTTTTTTTTEKVEKPLALPTQTGEEKLPELKKEEKMVEIKEEKKGKAEDEAKPILEASSEALAPLPVTESSPNKIIEKKAEALPEKLPEPSASS